MIIGQTEVSWNCTFCHAINISPFGNGCLDGIRRALSALIAVKAFNVIQPPMTTGASGNQIMLHIFSAQRFIMQVMNTQAFGGMTNDTPATVKGDACFSLRLPGT